MDRYWLLTWTTYASWLPGDARGFVSKVREAGGPVIHNVVGTPYDANMLSLGRYAAKQARRRPIYLKQPHAAALLDQWRKLEGHRDWRLSAAAVMRNHVHVVVGVFGDPDPADLLRDFKSYGSRILNQRWGRPEGGRWWTASGSRRRLVDEQALAAAIAYVRKQRNPLLVWTRDDLECKQ